MSGLVFSAPLERVCGCIDAVLEKKLWLLTADERGSMCRQHALLAIEGLAHLRKSGSLDLILANPPETIYESVWDAAGLQWKLKPIIPAAQKLREWRCGNCARWRPAVGECWAPDPGGPERHEATRYTSDGDLCEDWTPIGLPVGMSRVEFCERYPVLASHSPGGRWIDRDNYASPPSSPLPDKPEAKTSIP